MTMPCARPVGAVLIVLLSVLLIGCQSTTGGPPPSGTVLPVGLQGQPPDHVHYLSMADALEPDPLDQGKQMLSVTIHLHADSATQGVFAFQMTADPATGPTWPYPAYAGGSPDAAGQQVNLPAGDDQVVAKFPLRVRVGGKVQPNTYNIQSGGFYDVAIYAGGLPTTPANDPVALFQTSRLYALPDFGGPPPTRTPVPTATPAGLASPNATVRPTPTFAPTSTPEPTATPLPPPFAVGLLAVQEADQLSGSVIAVAGVGGATITAPPGQKFVVALFVVRRDSPTDSTNAVPAELSVPNGGSWKPDNKTINAQTGSLFVTLPTYGPVGIVYDPRSHPFHERRVAAQIWLAPAGAVTNPDALRFDGQPASAYPMSSVTWVDPGFPYHLKDQVPLSSLASVQPLSAEPVAAIGTPTPGAAQPGLKISFDVNGSSSVPVVIQLRLIVEDQDGLRAQTDCPVQNYPKLVLGQAVPFSCAAALPPDGTHQGYHLGITGVIEGNAVPVQWVDLGG